METIKKKINPRIIEKYLDYNETFNPNYSFTNITLRKDIVDAMLKQINHELSNIDSLEFIKKNYLFDDIEIDDSIGYHITLSYNTDDQIQKRTSPFVITLEKPLQIDTNYKDFSNALLFRPSNTSNKFFLSVNLKECKELRELYGTTDMHISIAHFYSSLTVNELNESLKAINISASISDLLKDIDHEIFHYLQRNNMRLKIFQY